MQRLGGIMNESLYRFMNSLKTSPDSLQSSPSVTYDIEIENKPHQVCLGLKSCFTSRTLLPISSPQLPCNEFTSVYPLELVTVLHSVPNSVSGMDAVTAKVLKSIGEDHLGVLLSINNFS